MFKGQVLSNQILHDNHLRLVIYRLFTQIVIQSLYTNATYYNNNYAHQFTITAWTRIKYSVKAGSEYDARPLCCISLSL